MLVQVDNLGLSIGKVPILKGVRLTMDKGEIYGLLGPNGAGKSTTLSVLTGLRRADSGTVRVLGLDPATQARELRRSIGVLAEDSGFYGWMSAAAYLRFMANLYGIEPSPETLAQQFALVGLEGAEGKAIANFSRGMKQRLGLARALLNDPQLLILDEPTNGLDPRGRRDIHDLLIRLSVEREVGILLCTHLLDDVDRLCTRVGIIGEGSTLIEGNIAELLGTRPGAGLYRLRLGRRIEGMVDSLPQGVKLLAQEGDWVHLYLPSSLISSEVWRTLLDAGWDIVEIHGESGGLEALYLELTEKEGVA
ncbi:MAG TPA: ABC transporter ATP-binding protein [Sulfuricella sp.]|nr:ABC transporter ATP-binding protein [Sulfuricella sp.]